MEKEKSAVTPDQVKGFVHVRVREYGLDDKKAGELVEYIMKLTKNSWEKGREQGWFKGMAYMRERTGHPAEA